MRSVVMIMHATAIVVVAASTAAAQPPSFAGRWVARTRTASAHPERRPVDDGNARHGLGLRPDPQQDATTLTVEYARFAPQRHAAADEARLPAGWIGEP